METFDLIITIGCLIVGFMMLTGRGDILLNDKDAANRNKLYDMKKAQKGYGVAFLVIGVASAISMRVKTQIAFAIYLAVVVVALVASVVYMKKCCKR